MKLTQHLGSLWFYLPLSNQFLSHFSFACGSPPSSPRSLYSHPGAAQPVSASAAPESPKKYTNPATIPGTFSTTVDSRGSNSNLSSRSSSQSSLSLASSLSPQQAGTLNVGRLDPLIQAPSQSNDASSELFSPTTWHYVVCAFIAFYIAYRTLPSLPPVEGWLGWELLTYPVAPPQRRRRKRKRFCRGERVGLHVGYLLKSNFIVLQLLRDEEGWRDKAD